MALNRDVNPSFCPWCSHRELSVLPPSQGDVAPATRRGGRVVGCLQRSLEAQLPHPGVISVILVTYEVSCIL